MKIYLAGSYIRRHELLGYSEILKQDGYEITSVWLTGIHEQPEWTPELYALDDEKCIHDCDIFLGFTEPEYASPLKKRGGRHFEAGLARAMGKRIIIVGPRENSFYHLPGISQVKTLRQAQALLKRERAMRPGPEA